MNMLERWAIEPSPTSRDPNRHTLLLRASKLDVYSVLREFGSLCGRPRKISREDYNYSVPLHGISPQNLQHIEDFLGRLAKKATAESAVSITSPQPENRIQPPQSFRAPAPPSTPIPEPEAEIKVVPSGPPPEPTPEPHTPEVPPRQERLFGALSRLHPLQNFDTLIVGPFNRFAHAAGTAVVSNPGSMYNPLILFGAPGAGKSHFLGAIGHSLEERPGGKKVFSTTGCRLSWATDLAAAQNKTEELVAHAKDTAGLLIDDVHLITLYDRNQDGLRTIIHHYLDSGKPLIMTSVYSPTALRFLEEALRFEIGSGYSVEIKMAPADARLQILKMALGRLGFRAGEEEIKELQGIVERGFGEINRYFSRLDAVKMMASAGTDTIAIAEMLSALLPKTGRAMAGSLAAEKKEVAALGAAMSPTTGISGTRNLGLVFPTGRESEARQILVKIRDAAQRCRLRMPANAIAVHAYDSNQLSGVPMAIAEACKRAGVSAVVMMGPMPETELVVRENELLHALDHILGDLNIAFAMIPASRPPEPAVYMRAVLDIYFGLWAPPMP